MLTKNCRILLRIMTKDKDAFFSIPDLHRLSGLSGGDTVRAAKYLLDEHYVQYQEPPSVPFEMSRCSDPPIELTELGANYRAVLIKEFLKYLADKWIDILASVISIVSLIVSIRTALSS